MCGHPTSVPPWLRGINMGTVSPGKRAMRKGVQSVQKVVEEEMGPTASPQREDRGWRKARVGSTRTHSPMQEGGPGLRMVPPGSPTSLLGQFGLSPSPSRSRVKLAHWRCSWRIQAQNPGRVGGWGTRSVPSPGTSSNHN